MTKSVQTLANDFVGRRAGRVHNAHTDGEAYTLHDTSIARWVGKDHVWFNWGGHYTKTTASHMNAILRCLSADVRVNHAIARDLRQHEFVVRVYF